MCVFLPTGGVKGLTAADAAVDKGAVDAAEDKAKGAASLELKLTPSNINNSTAMVVSFPVGMQLQHEGQPTAAEVPTMAIAMEAESIKEEDKAAKANHGESPAPMEGIMGQEEEGWNKVKPSKKKQNKVNGARRDRRSCPLKTFQGNQLQQHPSPDIWKWTKALRTAPAEASPPRQPLWLLLPREPQRRESL
jgi:hypothetical protein